MADVADIQLVIDAVRDHWPRSKTTPAMVRGILKRFGRPSAETVVAAIKRWYSDNLDAKAPVWHGIGQVVRAGQRKDRGIRGVAWHEHGEAARRANVLNKWRASQAMHEERGRELCEWLTELLEVVASGEAGYGRTVGVADLEAWDEATDLWGKWEFYGPGWRGDANVSRFTLMLETGTDDAGTPISDDTRKALPEIIRRANVRWHYLRQALEAFLPRAHFIIRNLRTFGAETDRFRSWALSKLEEAARECGVELDAVEYAHEQSPF